MYPHESEAPEMLQAFMQEVRELIQSFFASPFFAKNIQSLSGLLFLIYLSTKDQQSRKEDSLAPATLEKYKSIHPELPLLIAKHNINEAAKQRAFEETMLREFFTSFSQEKPLLQKTEESKTDDEFSSLTPQQMERFFQIVKEGNLDKEDIEDTVAVLLSENDETLSEEEALKELGE